MRRPLLSPITTVQGLVSQEFLEHKRNVLVLGAGFMGKAVVRLFKRTCGPGYKFSYAELSEDLIGSTVEGLKVDSVQEIAQKFDFSEGLVVVLNEKIGTALRDELRKVMTEQETLPLFKKIFQLSRQEAVIETTNDYIFTHRPNGTEVAHMPVTEFKEIVKKITNELPQLFKIDLSGWADPIKHPNLPELLSSVDERYTTTVTTKLQCTKKEIDLLLQSPPTLITVYVNCFNISGTDDQLDTFEQNLRHLKESTSTKAIPVELRVQVDKYKDDDILRTKVNKIAEGASVRVVESVGYINPYDNLRDLIFSANSEQEKRQKFHAARLEWEFEYYHKRANELRAKPCLCQRIFPVIDWLGNVRNCHLYMDYYLEGRFLSHSYFDFIERRRENDNCAECQSIALHRLDVDNINIIDGKK